MIFKKQRVSFAKGAPEGVCFDIERWIALGWLRLDRGKERGAAAGVGSAHGGAMAGDGRSSRFEGFRAVEREPLAPGCRGA